MPAMTNKTLASTSSSDIANAIRNTASAGFRNAVPMATGDNIREVGQAILSDTNYTNEFLGALISRIAKTLISSKIWNNPLKQYKMGMLTMGEVVQDIFVNKVEEKEYSMYRASKEVYKIAMPDIRAVYYEVKSRKEYKATINEDLLEGAFLNENSIYSLVTGIINRMTTQDENFEFLTMVDMIKKYNDAHKFYPIQVVAPTDKDSAKNLIMQIRASFAKLQFLNEKYNYMGVLTNSRPEDLMLVISADLQARVDVDVLASAFNMNKTDFMGHLTVIPEMPDNKLVALLIDKDWWRIFDKKILMTQQRNNEGLYTNYFLHHWEVFANNPFANAIAFITETPQVSNLTLDSSSLEIARGTSATLKATITGSEFIGAIEWSADSGYDLNVQEMVSTGDSCTIRIREDAIVNAEVVITAKSIFDNTKTATCTIKVTS